MKTLPLNPNLVELAKYISFQLPTVESLQTECGACQAQLESAEPLSSREDYLLRKEEEGIASIDFAQQTCAELLSALHGKGLLNKAALAEYCETNDIEING